MPVLVKICGTTSVGDARLAQEVGTDFLGIMLNYPPSPRHIAREIAKGVHSATPVPLVVLSVNQPLDALIELENDFKPRALQLHGDEPPSLVEELASRGFKVWKALSGDEQALVVAAHDYRSAGAEAILVDARETTPSGIVYGGTGHVADWNAARRLVDDGYQVILAGGLTPDNVARAVETVRPWSVDVVSGVEERKGVKDAAKLRDFVARAKG